MNYKNKWSEKAHLWEQASSFAGKTKALDTPFAREGEREIAKPTDGETGFRVIFTSFEFNSEAELVGTDTVSEQILIGQRTEFGSNVVRYKEIDVLTTFRIDWNGGVISKRQIKKEKFTVFNYKKNKMELERIEKPKVTENISLSNLTKDFYIVVQSWMECKNSDTGFGESPSQTLDRKLDGPWDIASESAVWTAVVAEVAKKFIKRFGVKMLAPNHPLLKAGVILADIAFWVGTASYVLLKALGLINVDDLGFRWEDAWASPGNLNNGTLASKNAQAPTEPPEWYKYAIEI